jgi:ABC-2 type transport system permease protein
MWGKFQTEFLQYRVGNLMWFGVNLLDLAAKIFLWTAIFKNADSEVLNGFSLELMIVYIIATQIVFHLTFLNPQFEMAEDIRMGTIAMKFIKPISYRVQIFFSSLGHLLGEFFFGIIPISIIFTIYVTITGIHISMISVLLFILSVVVSFLINFLIAFSFGMMVFYTKNGFGIMQLKDVVFLLLSGSLIPIEFYPEFARKIVDVLPFKQVVYVPISILIGNLNGIDAMYAIGYQALWIGVLYVLFTLVWKHTVKRVVVQGG